MRDLALNLGVDMVAEGVETEDIRDAVSVLAVPLLQGYAVAMPMPLEDLAMILAKLKRRRNPPPEAPSGRPCAP